MQLKRRLTYLDKELVEKLPSFVVEEIDTTQQFVIGRLKKYPILSIIKLLYPLTINEMLSFTNLFTSSGIRLRASFCDYLNFCKEYNFVNRTEIKKYKAKGHTYVEYRITDRGRFFLNLFLEKQEVQIVSYST